jgi:putative transcriptional regulator
MGKKAPRVANRLRELRREFGLTQEKLAEGLEVTRHTIIALEVGRYVPSIELALRLAAYFEQPLESIFWLEQEEETKPMKAARDGEIHRQV